MEAFFIQPARRLEGVIPVRGAKNSILKAMAASLLFRTPFLIDNVPHIVDYQQMENLLVSAGVLVERVGERQVRLTPPRHPESTLDPEVAQSFRSSVVLIGPLLARTGKAVFPYPGGCVIGKRPIDLFLEGLARMGALVREENGIFTLSAKRLIGADIFFRKVSVTATETLMMAAVLARGKTVLSNAAREPEIPALAEFLNLCGARISGAGTSTITIRGGAKLDGARRVFRIIPDRVEAGSFAILAALRGGRLRVANCVPEHLAGLLAALREAGVFIECGKDWVEITAPKQLFPVNVQTREYPGFVTDFQSPFMVLLTQAVGMSTVFETIYEGRLEYTRDLNRMGAEIILCDPHRAIVVGPTPLFGRVVESPDLRAGLAFILAALVAKGPSTVQHIYHIDRGYERIEERLCDVGADIKRVACAG
ncbi:MAG: UDP-N-acetylglucosamine 1-carboxyvinyltransferase [Parcubacteria group bacterium]|nr:UDP-N-acetylglucosamine 1-carboxyvinyltransferase [Parcubacteria group bacterium]